MKHLIPFFAALLFIACSSSEPQPVQEPRPIPPAPTQTPAAELLPYAQETQSQMAADYQDAVEVLNGVQYDDDLEKQKLLIQKHIEFLLEAKTTVDTIVLELEQGNATSEQLYRSTVRDWRERSALVYQMLQNKG